jgi:hypothetical protein
VIVLHLHFFHGNIGEKVLFDDAARTDYILAATIIIRNNLQDMKILFLKFAMKLIKHTRVNHAVQIDNMVLLENGQSLLVASC